MPPGKNTSRRSIAVYFYTREAPPQGASPAHATFYYQRPLPGNLQPGHTLTEADVQEVADLLASRQLHSFSVSSRVAVFKDTVNSHRLAYVSAGNALRQVVEIFARKKN